MLQSVRDNMKGGLVAFVVILFFVVPLVLTGVGDGSFLGSAAGTDAAEVDGKNISNMELSRAVQMRKNQILSQDGVDPSADFLKDENLRGPVLDGLVKQAALVESSRDAGVEIADEIIDGQIGTIDAFKIDGKFDKQAYRRLLANLNYTSTGFRNMLAEEMLSRQHAEAITMSAFNTDKELDILVSLIQQKRSFFTVQIPKEKVVEGIEATDEDIAAYYEEHKPSYAEPEKVSINYIQLSVDALAKDIEVNEEDIKAQYEAEKQNFQKSVEYEVAHILIEDKEGKEAVVSEVQSKLAGGEDFSALAASYSDDSGTKENGGNLGVLTPGVFPEAFEQAVYTLSEGDVSEPVVTDAGTHFIKVVSKKTEVPPTFEERKDAIVLALKKAAAEEKFVGLADQLGELSFTAPNLQEVAEAIGLKVQSTAPFSATSGAGIAGNAVVREAAFSSDVLKEGYNSKVIEVSAGNSVVLRKKEHFPERTKSLDEVKDSIITAVEQNKTQEKLEALAAETIEAIKGGDSAGDSAEAFAQAQGYEFKSYDKVKRADATADYQVLNSAFTTAKSGQDVVYNSVADVKGNQVVVGLQEVIPGSRADMPEQQMKALISQLRFQGGRFEATAFEDQVLADAKVEIY
ncbi:Peptidyl-prolyl cis-trans isomerase D [Thalassocella blandensis]|nr:Peptidyl-prolyl cis-trans isomerase D [Thalassocella blandensis]